MERAKFQKKDLKIPGRSGPFAIKPLKTKALFELTENTRDNKLDMADQYMRIVQQSLVYEKSKKLVYSEKQLDKMDDELGGGKIVELGNQAMIVNGLMDATDIDKQIEAAQKN